MKTRLLVLLLLAFCGYANAQTWTAKNPFEHKVFIENKGQFDERKIKNENPEQIKYGIALGGVEIYFTAHGLTYRYDEVQPMSEEEIREAGFEAGQANRQEQKEEREKMTKRIPRYINMEWIGANPETQLIAENAVSHYFTYGNPNDKTGKSGIKASAYKKIIYKNLYPNIDVEYVFPADSGGIKYSFTLYPGADPSVIKMNYTGAEKIKIYRDKGGNMVIKSPFGDITDHAPLSFFKNGGSITSSFALSGSTVSFKLNDLQTLNFNPKTIIIDPWTTVPTFTGYNGAYDVEYDFQGNVYIYGGAYPFQEIKLDNTGAIQWIYTATVFTNPPIYYGNFYGDFAVDGSSGISYIVEGYNPIGAKAIKVNTTGDQIGLFPGNSNFEEMWRVVYNNCTKQAVIAGGGTNARNQACILDTNVSNMAPVNVLSANEAWHDFSLLAIDNSNNCYMATARSNANANFDNMLLKCPANTLLPVTYMVADNYSFMEVNSIVYVTNAPGGGASSAANGMNGMAVSPNFLYTYDGRLIQRWNKNTGILINSATIGPAPFSWGGIAVDDCDNIYVGVQSSVVRYDTAFNVISTLITANTVYDVRLAPGNLLYACGKQFVSSFQLSGVNCNSLALTVVPTNGSCTSSGSATATLSGGTSPYIYSWSNGQTTSTATGLSAGTYTVTVIDNSCVPKSQTDTVVITSSSGLSATITPANVSCFGASTGSVIANPSGGTSPFTYLWNNNSTNQQINNLPAGNYTVTVTDANGCPAQQTVTITQPSAITASASSTNADCNSSNGTATAAAGGGTGTLTYSWLPSQQTTAAATGLSAGIYSVTITDANGCTQTATAVVTQTGGPTATVTATITTLTPGNSTTLIATGGGTYLWYPSTGLSCITCANPVVTPPFGGQGGLLYCVTVTDANNCTDTACVTITTEPLPCGALYIPNAFAPPNAFSPNNDKENEKLCVYGNCIEKIELFIYNRWGEKVFETTDISRCWDGTYRGKLLNTAVFVYYMEATLTNGEKIMKKGNVSLIR